MRTASVFIIVLSFMLCSLASSKATTKTRTKKQQGKRAKARSKRSRGTPPVVPVKMKAVNTCAVCTEHGGICALPSEKPMFQIMKMTSQEMVQRWGETPPAPSYKVGYLSKLVEKSALPDARAACDSGFESECTAMGGTALCGADKSTYCSEPLTHEQCFLILGHGKKVSTGGMCPPKSETCSPGVKFSVGPWECQCSEMGLFAGSKCMQKKHVSLQFVSSLDKDGTISDCKSSCLGPPMSGGFTRRRRGVSGCLMGPRALDCPRQLVIVKDGEEPPPPPPKQCAVCTAGGSRCVKEDAKVEFLLTATKVVAGAGKEKKGMELDEKELEIVKEEVFASPEDLAKVMAKIVEMDEIVIESFRVRSQMQLAATDTTNSSACRRGLNEDEKELISLCSSAGGSVRLEGCLDVFCTVPIVANKCKVNGEIAIKDEVCPEEESVFCAPGKSFEIGNYATCKCTNGLKAMATCKPLIAPSEGPPPPGESFFNSMTKKLAAFLTDEDDRASHEANTTSVPPVMEQLSKCASTCNVMSKMVDGKVVSSKFSSKPRPVLSKRSLISKAEIDVDAEDEDHFTPDKKVKLESMKGYLQDCTKPVLVPAHPETIKPIKGGEVKPPKPIPVKPVVKPKPETIVKPPAKEVVPDKVTKPTPKPTGGSTPMPKPMPKPPSDGSCVAATKYAKLAYKWAMAAAKKSGVTGSTRRRRRSATKK